MTKKELNELTYSIIGAAIEVHKELSPGLLESVYHKCLKQELDHRRLYYQSELHVDVNYKGVSLDAELRCDLLEPISKTNISLSLRAALSEVEGWRSNLETKERLLRRPIKQDSSQ